ncbi:MAG: hypothetical protein WC622_07125 [Pedobacter sp.]|jgi:hypothetical protein|uniref:hypothetical protein n=1 Tax=Pedobacter sp. TaxID=1411316 RepID=UPI00356B37AA
MTKLFIVAVLGIYTTLNLTGSFNLKGNYQTTQQTAQDTTKYLKDNFVNNKTKFQHRELKCLLAKLKLNIKSYDFVRGKKVGEIQGIFIYFEGQALIKVKRGNQIRVKKMYISFEKPVSLYTDVSDLYNKSNGEWLPAEAAFYGNQLVKDIVSGN